MNISIGLTQCGLIWGLRSDDFIMKLIYLLIRELKNCSLGGDFRVSRHAEICHELPKEYVVVIMEFPDWFKLKWKYYI